MILSDLIQTITTDLISLRRDFHRHPELGTTEYRTSEKIKSYLEAIGIVDISTLADTGIVACITGKGSGQGNVVALRADMDALPLTEPANRSYASECPGIMHACGHDAHITIQLGVANILKQLEQEWSGTVKFFFQPAEETIGGAERMVQEGCMTAPTVDYVTGLHVMPSYPTGHIELKHGKLNASSDEIMVTIQGIGCHGAYPENGVDAIVVAAALIQSLQTLVSRNTSPLNSVVLTFGKIAGGTAGNIIADKVELTGTLRTTDGETRKKTIALIERQVAFICEAYGSQGTLMVNPGYAALLNTDEIVDLLAQLAKEQLGADHIHWKEHPSLGVEDFSFFLEKAPGVFYHLGCANENKGITAPLHNCQFDIDEDCLAIGVKLQTLLTLKLLAR